MDNKEIYIRDFERDIEKWFTSNQEGNALVVTGARQVGKTTGILNWAQRTNRRMVYIDFSRDKRVMEDIVTGSSYESIVRYIASTNGIKQDDIDVIFLDEIQLHPDSLYLCRLFKNQKIKLICSGSLLGTKLSLASSRTDVGSKSYLRVYPLGFNEFIKWIGKEDYLEFINESFETKKQIPSAIHKELLDWFYQFLIVGGMPEVVRRFVNQNMVIDSEIEKIKANIYNDYLSDNQKSFYSYDENRKETIKTIDIIYNLIDRFIIQPDNKKFIISDVNKNFRFANIEVPLEILKNSNIVIASNCIETPQYPLEHMKLDSQFKLYYSDVGLLTHKLKLTYKAIMKFASGVNDNSGVWGGIIENFVAQELRTNDLYFWKGETKSNRRYQIDFLFQDADEAEIYPCEVKSKTGSHKDDPSLPIYIEKYEPKQIICIGPNNFAQHKNRFYLPLYATYKLKDKFKL